MVAGLVSSVVLAVLGPACMGAAAIFPIVNPAIASVPIGFLGAVLGALLSRRAPVSEAQFDEVLFRAQTGLREEAPVPPVLNWKREAK